MPLPGPVRRAALVGAAVALLGFAVLASGGDPSELVERGPFTSAFFDEQAHALLGGHLDVDPEVAGIEGFEHDGRTHFYFGLFPAVLRLPVAAVTEELDGRLTSLSMLLALSVTLWATAQLLWRGRRWQRQDDPELHRWEPAAFGVFVAAVGLASPLLFLSSRAIVYHEVELWGTATTLLALDRLLAWWEEPTRGRLAVASLTALVALNTRASVGGGAVAALALVLGLALLWQHVGWRQLPTLALAVLVPVASYAAVNFARFDSLFSAPFEDQVFSGVDPGRQATLDYTGGGLFALEFAPSAVATYLRPDGVSVQRLFPWITFREEPTLIGTPVFDTVDRSASLPVIAPGFVALAGIGIVARIRRRSRDPWLAAAAGAAMGLVATLTIAFIANRYLADFTPTLVLLAALGLWVAGDALAARRPVVRRLVLWGAITLIVMSGITSFALALQAQRLLILPDDADRRGFVGLQYDIDGAFDDGPPAAVRRGGLPDAPGPRGQLSIVGDCRALYWSDGTSSYPLERGHDLGIGLSGPIPPGSTTLAEGDGWSVEIDRTGDEATVRWVPARTDGGQSSSGPLVEVDEAESHDLTVNIDPVNSEIVVLLDGDLALRAWPVRVTGPVSPGPAWDAAPRRTPLCDRLLARLEP